MDNTTIFIMDALESSSSESESDLLESLEEPNSDEERILIECVMALKQKRVKIENYLEDVVPCYSEEDFKMHFRISKLLFNDLCTKFENSDIYNNMRRDKRLSAQTYLAVFLWFAGHQTCFRDVADRFNIAIGSVTNIINRAMDFISNLSPDIIKWPNAEKIREANEFFKNKCVFPNVIGCIDGTHIRIDLRNERKDDYIDRKGITSIILQGICNYEKKFIDVFVGYPGSSHDSWVFQNSPLFRKLPTICGDNYLLGDSAYPCSKYVITPYRDNGHLTQAQKSFNMKLSSGRISIEHTFGLLKQRFRQLYHCKLRNPRKICHFVRACCVLHNIANDDDLDFESGPQEDMEELQNYVEPQQGSNAFRDALCQYLREH